MKSATAIHVEAPPTAREALAHFQHTTLAAARARASETNQRIVAARDEATRKENALKAAPVPSAEDDQATFIRRRDNLDYLRQQLAAAEHQVNAAGDVHRGSAQALQEANSQAADLLHTVLVEEARGLEAELGALACQATAKLAQLDAIGSYFRKTGVVGRPIETFGALRNRVSGFWMGATVSQAEDRAATERLAAFLRDLEG